MIVFILFLHQVIFLSQPLVTLGGTATFVALQWLDPPQPSFRHCPLTKTCYIYTKKAFKQGWVFNKYRWKEFRLKQFSIVSEYEVFGPTINPGSPLQARRYNCKGSVTQRLFLLNAAHQRIQLPYKPNKLQVARAHLKWAIQNLTSHWS